MDTSCLTPDLTDAPAPSAASVLQVIDASELKCAEEKLVKVEKELEQTKTGHKNTLGRWGKISRLSRRPYMNLVPARVGTGETERSPGLRPASVAALEAKKARAEVRRKATQKAEEEAARAKALEERHMLDIKSKKNNNFGGCTERKMVVGLHFAGQSLSAVQH